MLKTDQEYRNQIKEVGNYNLINTNKWKERAIFFQENGYYTELVEDTHDWLKFWEEEENRIMNGIWIDNFYIPGLYYFYLNYLPIYRKQDNKFDFPDVYDMDYHTFLCLEHAEFLKLDFAVIKARQRGFEQPYSELVLTIDGWKEMGHLKLKDKLYDNLGNIVEVDAIYEQGEKDVYEIELLDKRKVRCGIEHLWKVIDRKSRSKSEKVMSLKDILQKDITYNVTAPTKKGIKNYKGYRFSINEIQSIPFTSKDLKIPPYVLGCLLGDGSFSKTQIRLTSMDNEIFDNVIQLLGEDFYYGNKELDVNKSSWRCTIRYKKRFDNETNKDFVNFKYGVNPLNRYISFYNLDTTNTYTKFIPLDYLHSSFEDRLELLQGLMDTDGYINEEGQDIHYTTVSEKLAKDVAYLCRSMGINCTIDKKNPQKENHSFFYRVRIKSKFPLFKLKRKLKRQKTNGNYRKSIPIISINKLDYKEKSRCISVTGENKMYITTDFIPTHNTLKFCAPLIRELFFSRGSPNYIATYEEAQVLKTWTEVIEPYREHINTNTPWYRDFNPSKPLNWRVAKEVINEQGKKLVQGRKNTLKGLVLSKSVSKGVGGSGRYILHDEAGVSPVVSKFVGYVKPMITYGNTKTGTIIISGAVGELKHLERGLKEYITKPDENGFYSVDNVWDVDNEFSGRKCGFFVPESWAYHGIDDDPDSDFYGQSFIDKWGNSKVKEAERYIKKLRKGEIPGKPIELDKFSISQTPLSLSECFQHRDENIFPTELINPQIEKVNKKENHGIYIDLYETEKKEVKHKLLNKYDHLPVLEHPIDPKNQKKKEGVIQIWEMPLSEKPPYGVYWAGVDIVRDSTSINSSSLNCIYIYKGAHSLKNEYNEKIIVAKYMARPKDKMDWFKKAMLLLEFYNAEALVENNVNWFIEESIKINKQYKIAKTPQWVKDMTPQGTSYITKPYGVVMTPKLKEKIIDAISRYIKEPIHTEYDEVTGEPTQHFGIERINDLQLLRELVNFRTDSGNFDSIISFGLALLQAEYNEIRGVVIKNNNENLKFNKKNLNLLMSNRFTRTNLKKLANGNNI